MELIAGSLVCPTLFSMYITFKQEADFLTSLPYLTCQSFLSSHLHPHICQAFRLSPSLTPSDDSLLLCLVPAPFSLPFYIYNHSWPDTIPLKMTMIDMGMDTAWCLACSKQLVSALEKSIRNDHANSPIGQSTRHLLQRCLSP